MGTFRNEDHLQAALKTIEVTRIAFPKGKDAKGLVRTSRTKTQLQKIKPSIMLKRDQDLSDSD